MFVDPPLVRRIANAGAIAVVQPFFIYDIGDMEAEMPPVFVKVLTDQDGLFGWGEATLEWHTRAVVGISTGLCECVVIIRLEPAERAERAVWNS